MVENKKKANTDRKSPPKKKMARQEKIETPQAITEIEKEKGFLGEVAEDIGEGAKTARIKATEIGDIVIEKLKKGLSQAYTAGARVVDELSHTAQEYTEKYKAESEVRNLNGEKDKLLAQLGYSIFRRYSAEGKVRESFFNGKEIVDQFNQIEMLDKKIIKAGKQLDIKKRNKIKTA